MFEWMPTLLIFIVPALTMKMWSEERRSGTLELLLTSPVTNLQLVLGKFLACMMLVAVAVGLTFPLPLCVSLFLGNLDWGPVIGGYIATLFLAGAYTSIGLYVSAKSENQIVSLIITILICGLFLIIGSDSIANLFDSSVGESLKLIGTGSRFQSITRGVIDFRDLYYYLSIIGLFLSLNVLGLEKLRWSGNRGGNRHLQWILVTWLAIGNFVAANFWLQQVGWARADITEHKIYSISAATRNYLKQLKEPLLIRGYFSKKTHPFLAPLVPQLKDIMKEYAIAGNGMVKVDFIDPLETPELEREAGEKYGIKPVAFQTADKYQAAVVNSYFDVVIVYGDQFQRLGFRDLIEVKMGTGRDVDVELRNPEYDITSAIKKALYSYQAEGNPFARIEKPVKFIGYISPANKLPKQLTQLRTDLETVIAELKKKAKGKLEVEFIDPDAGDGKVAEKIESELGFRRMAVSIDPINSFWFYMIFSSGDQKSVVQLPEQLSKTALERSVDSALKRFSKGFLKTVAIMGNVRDAQVFEGESNLQHYSTLKEYLENEYALAGTNLKDGDVPQDTDILLVLAPSKLEEKQVFAIDQFLMKGGTVLVASSQFSVSIGKTLSAEPRQSGLDAWLDKYGLKLDRSMVLDTRYSPFPIPGERMVGTYVIPETHLVPYPYFANVRESGMNEESGLFSGINEITMSWTSPIKLDKQKIGKLKLTELVKSSPEAWTSESYAITPDQKKFGELGFESGKDKGEKLLAVTLEGEFESFFKGKKSPLATSRPATDPAIPENMPLEDSPDARPAGLIEKSAGEGRIILFGSDTFMGDELLRLSSMALGSSYMSPIELIKNAIDWSLEDRDLLAIRGRGHFARTLGPVKEEVQVVFEYMSYIVVLLCLASIAGWRRFSKKKDRARHQAMLDSLQRKGAKV